MTKLIAKLDRKTGEAVRWLDERWWVGPPLRIGLAIMVAVIPIAQAYSGTRAEGFAGEMVRRFSDPRWVWLFLVALAVLVPLQKYHGGSVRRRILLSLARANGSFAGSLLSFGHKLAASKQRKLTDEECQSLCIALLHRIRDLAAIALGVDTEPRLRATLAVPYITEDGADALRVWCYDETHPDRGFTIIPMHLNGTVAPGAPAAYVTREWQVVSDLHRVPGATRRGYRSILCLPLEATGTDGRPLAVVSIDASEPNFFDGSEVAEEVRPLVSPAVTAIGLVLLTRRMKGPYAFPR